MDTIRLAGGVGGILVGLLATWIAIPDKGTISRPWLRSQVGMLYPLIPVVLIVFGLFTILSVFGLA